MSRAAAQLAPELEGLQVERLPTGEWEAWREDDVDPEGYPRGTGKTPDDAVEDLLAELADAGEPVPSVARRDDVHEVPRCPHCRAITRCKCESEEQDE